MLNDLDENALLRLARMVAGTGYDFVTPTPTTIARVNARPGANIAHDMRDVFGWSRPCPPGLLPAPIEHTARDAGVLVPTESGLRSLIRFSSLDGVLLMHSAYPTTQADSVFFGPDTYRFTRAIRQAMPPTPRRVVDIGCGTGSGAIMVARACPNAVVFGVDINPAALMLTRVNATLADVAVSAQHSDLLRNVDGEFDLIVANPPYMVDPGERTYRHGGGPLGAGLSLQILDTAIVRLGSGGTLLLYTGACIVAGEDVFRHAAAAALDGSGLNWTYEEIDPDVFGEELDAAAYAETDRIAAVLLTVKKE